MRFIRLLYLLLCVVTAYLFTISNSGCGQIGMPTGGPIDSIPPRLMSASPEPNSTNFNGNKITLTFDEYIDLKDAQNNVLISPYPKKAPTIDYRLKTVTVKLKDSLLPNTTYSINFGNAIVDNNEGNPLQNLSYVFSTGNQIDSFMLAGKVLIAETGKADSTLSAMLYRSTDDSAVLKNKPDYIAKLNGDGSFVFVNLPAGTFNLYALKDGDGGKTYNSKKELFAFADDAVTISEKTDTVILYASALEKDAPPASRSSAPAKKLVYTIPPGAQTHDLLAPFEISFNSPLKIFDSTKLILRDTNYNPIRTAYWQIDSTRTKAAIVNSWGEASTYLLVMDSTALEDTVGNRLTKTDTIRFTTRQQTDYGNLVLRFSNLNLSMNPVLQLVQGDAVKKSFKLTANQWSNKFIEPGEYEIRILLDKNQNGIWDPGDYSNKLQPEIVIPITQKIGVRANWDNERDINL